jgi:Protein of unknown function (DUF3168)
MQFEEALEAYLQADSGVTALWGAGMLPDAALPGTLAPYVCYTRTTTTPDQDLVTDDDSPTLRLQIDCYAATRAACRALAKAIRNSQGGGSGLRLKEFQGLLGTGCYVGFCRVENYFDGWDKTQDATGSPARRVTFDLVAGVTES